MDAISTYFSRETLVPMLLIGGAITLVMNFYQGSLLPGVNPSALINKGVDSALGVVGMNSQSGVGMYIAYGLHLIISGFLVTGALMVASKLRKTSIVRAID